MQLFIFKEYGEDTVLEKTYILKKKYQGQKNRYKTFISKKIKIESKQTKQKLIERYFNNI